MEQPIPLPVLLDKVKDLLATQSNVPSSFLAPTLSTSTQPKPPVLPASIPLLPESATVLPSKSSPSLDTLTSLLSTHLLPYLNLSSLSPNYYGFVIGGTTPAALLADFIVSIYDQNVHVHLPHDTISTSVEVAALNLLVELFWLPQESWGVGSSTGNGGGVITTGATSSNVIGLALGREYVLREAARRRAGNSLNGEGCYSCGELGLLKMARLAGVDDIVVLSTLPHSSIAKAASIVGIGRTSVIDIANKQSEDGLGVDLQRLEQLASTASHDRKAYILALSAGEVNTGRYATGGLEEMTLIRKICDDHGIWIHVDAAFGLFGRVLMNTPESATEYPGIIKGVEGIELADSITGDGHKLLNVPYDCGLFFTRHKTLSEDVFRNGNAAYLTSSSSSSTTNNSSANKEDKQEIQSPLNIGIENSKRFRALPVYATLMAYGRAGYVDMLRRQIGLARKIVAWMWAKDGLEVLPRSASLEESIAKTFIVVLFRTTDDTVNEGLAKKINATGQMYVSGTKWEGKTAVRIAVSNWQADVERDTAVVEEVLGKIVDKGKFVK